LLFANFRFNVLLIELHLLALFAHVFHRLVALVDELSDASLNEGMLFRSL
jgi:hypothetical protein